MGKILLKNSDVNSGTSVWLTESEIGFSLKNNINANSAEGKFDTIEIDYGGFNNPAFNIRGVIDIDNIPTNGITPILLLNFATATENPTYLTIPVGSTNHYIPGIRMYNSSGTEIGTTRISLGNSDTKYTTDTTVGWIKVRVVDFDVKIDGRKSSKGHFLNYSLTLMETT